MEKGNLLLRNWELVKGHYTEKLNNLIYEITNGTCYSFYDTIEC